MTRRLAQGAWILAIAAVELYLVLSYAAFGALFHYFLHGFVGGGLALVTLSVARRRRRSPAGPSASAAWTAMLAGHLLAAMPDVLFLAADLPHQYWIDVFVAHIAIHFAPAQLWLTLVMFLSGIGSWAAARSGARRLAAVAAALVVVLFVGALALRAPVPQTLSDVRDAGDVALWCQLPVDGTRVDVALIGKLRQDERKVNEQRGGARGS